MTNQIHPPISRLCEPIQGTDSAQIADCLGLDSSKFGYAAAHGTGYGDWDDMGFVPTSLLEDEEKYKNVEKLKVTCAACKR